MKQRELGRLQKRMDNLIEMRADGDLSKDMFRMKSEELEPKMQKLQKEIDELSQKREPKVIEHYKEKLAIRTSLCAVNWKENADLLRKLW